MLPYCNSEDTEIVSENDDWIKYRKLRMGNTNASDKKKEKIYLPSLNNINISELW